MRTAWLLAAAIALHGCGTYEYEEEVFLDVDGSGRLRVSGSVPLLEAFHVSDPSVSSMTAKFEGTGFELESVRETERDGRRFIHVQGSFADWNALCAHPAFTGRDCRLDASSDRELAIHLTLPTPDGGPPANVDADALLALRFHFPSTVSYHNSPSGIERGNIIEWERTVSEQFDATELVVEATFERRSVLATTIGVVGTAVGIVALAVALALYWMVRKGREQLALEADSSP